MKTLSTISSVLLIIGGLNWGLVGSFDFNLVAAIFGEGMGARVIYGVVGLAAIYKAIDLVTSTQTVLGDSPSREDSSRRAA